MLHVIHAYNFIKIHKVDMVYTSYPTCKPRDTNGFRTPEVVIARTRARDGGENRGPTAITLHRCSPVSNAQRNRKQFKPLNHADPRPPFNPIKTGKKDSSSALTNGFQHLTVAIFRAGYQPSSISWRLLIL